LPPAQEAGRVEHVVLVWMKDPGNAQHRAELIKAAYSLQDLPGIVHAYAGASLQSTRPEVDDSFDVALIFVFEDAAALEAYLINPRHVQAVTDVLAPRAARFLVYDFVEAPPAN
jgi:NaMN:DMB phosphoribosyltransferase